jgi:hypothetical protein
MEHGRALLVGERARSDAHEVPRALHVPLGLIVALAADVREERQRLGRFGFREENRTLPIAPARVAREPLRLRRQHRAPCVAGAAVAAADQPGVAGELHEIAAHHEDVTHVAFYPASRSGHRLP